MVFGSKHVYCSVAFDCTTLHVHQTSAACPVGTLTCMLFYVILQVAGAPSQPPKAAEGVVSVISGLWGLVEIHYQPLGGPGGAYWALVVVSGKMNTHLRSGILLISKCVSS